MLFGAGLALVAASFVMHSLFGHRFSKDFFTSSYVLLSSGSAMALLAFMYWVIDCRGWRGGLTWWFAIMGSNALFIYMVGEVLWTMVWMRWRVLGPDGSGQVMFTALQAHLAAMSSPAAGPWMATAIYIGIYWAASLFMLRKGIVSRCETTNTASARKILWNFAKTAMFLRVRFRNTDRFRILGLNSRRVTLWPGT